MSNHTFLKEKVTDKECHACNNLWPSTDIISKYNVCSLCGLIVHTGCKSSSQCIPCDSSLVKEIDNDRDSRFEISECNGFLKAHVLHAYDFANVNVGSAIYSNIKLLSVISEDVIQSSTSIVKDSGDVSWSIDNNKGIPIKYPLKKSNQPLSSETETANMYTPRTKSAKRVSQKKYFSLNIQLWRNMMFLFDSLIASVTISIVPVVMNPNVVTERWFALTNDAGEKCGMALLRLVFEPSTDAKVQLSPYMNKALNVLTSLDELVVKAAEHTPQIHKVEVEKVTTSAPTNPTFEKVTNFLSNLDTIVNQAAAPTPPAEPNPPSPVTPIQKEVVKAKEMIDINVSTAESRKEFLDNRNQQRSFDQEIKKQVKVPTFAPTSPAVVTKDNRISKDETKAAAVKEIKLVKTPPTPPKIPIAVAEKKTAVIRKSIVNNSLSEPLNPVILAGWANNVASSAWGLLYDVADVKKVSQPAKVMAKKASVVDLKKRKGDGVGRMIIHLESVHKSAVSDAAEGDHFVTASFDDSIPGEEEKSQTVLSSATPVFNVKWEMTASHYRAQMRIYLVDANNDRKVGVAKVTPYYLMQREADKYGKLDTSPDFEKLTMYDANNEKEEIGYFKISISFEEHTKNFFLSMTPKLAQTSPDETLSIERLSRHIDRFKLLLNFFTSLFDEYRSIMNWDNVPLTIFLFFVFVYTCLHIDAEYALCCPLFICVFLMTRSLQKRRFGSYRKNWIERGIPEDEMFRPVSYLRVAVVGFRKLPKEWKAANLSGTKPCVKISYFPVQNDISAAKMDKELVVGYVGGPNHGPSNDGTNSLSKFVNSLSGMIRNEHSKADLLQNTLDPWPTAGDSVLSADAKNKIVLLCDDEKTHISCVYPILKPIVKDNIVASEESDDVDKKAKKDVKQVPHLLPWEENDGIISFTIFQLNYLVDKAMGTVKIAIKDLVSKDKKDSKGLQPEVAGWFTVSNDNNVSSASIEELKDNAALLKQSTDSYDGNDAANKENSQFQVYLRMQLDIRNTPSLGTKEAHIALTQKEKDVSQTLYSILCDKDNESKIGIAALWNMPDNVVYVQNLMNWLLDIIESFKNIFDWTSPYKTLPIYVLLFLSWIAFMIVPGRYIILVIGACQFLDKFIPSPEANVFMTIYKNLLTTIPNDDDLEQIYIKDRMAIMKAKQDLQVNTINNTKLELISSYIWRGKVSLKCAGVNSSQGELTPVYLLLQKNRLVWWDKEKDLDDCKVCVGQLLLFGHAGVTSAGPVDIKAIGDNSRITAIFGSDSSGSILKCTIVFEDYLACTTFINDIKAVLKPTTKEMNDEYHVKKKRGKMINTNNTLIGCSIC